jgi:hypothetical protein
MDSLEGGVHINTSSSCLKFSSSRSLPSLVESVITPRVTQDYNQVRLVTCKELKFNLER